MMENAEAAAAAADDQQTKLVKALAAVQVWDTESYPEQTFLHGHRMHLLHLSHEDVLFVLCF